VVALLFHLSFFTVFTVIIVFVIILATFAVRTTTALLGLIVLVGF
jgi:hypothetical protein